jgi:hypothetical protein
MVSRKLDQVPDNKAVIAVRNDLVGQLEKRVLQFDLKQIKNLEIQVKELEMKHLENLNSKAIQLLAELDEINYIVGGKQVVMPLHRQKLDLARKDLSNFKTAEEKIIGCITAIQKDIQLHRAVEIIAAKINAAYQQARKRLNREAPTHDITAEQAEKAAEVKSKPIAAQDFIADKQAFEEKLKADPSQVAKTIRRQMIQNRPHHDRVAVMNMMGCSNPHPLLCSDLSHKGLCPQDVLNNSNFMFYVGRAWRAMLVSIMPPPQIFLKILFYFPRLPYPLAYSPIAINSYQGY